MDKEQYNLKHITFCYVALLLRLARLLNELSLKEMALLTEIDEDSLRMAEQADENYPLTKEQLSRVANTIVDYDFWDIDSMYYAISPDSYYYIPGDLPEIRRGEEYVVWDIDIILSSYEVEYLIETYSYSIKKALDDLYYSDSR